MMIADNVAALTLIGLSALSLGFTVGMVWVLVTRTQAAEQASRRERIKLFEFLKDSAAMLDEHRRRAAEESARPADAARYATGP